jgi:hypothetical protein
MNNKKIANTFIFISIVITGIFLLRMSLEDYNFWNSKIEFEKTGQIGDFIGGVVGTIISAAGFYFLYLTFNEQRKSFEKERLESKFFDLIKLHRDNVVELSFDGTQLSEDDDSLFIEKRIYNGKSVFKVIFNQFIICKNELNPFMRRKKMFLPEYEKELLENPIIKKHKINITVLAKIDICYSIVFYGLGSEGLLILRNNFSKKYKENFIDDILRFLSLKPANDDNILKKWMIVSNKNTRGKRNKLVEGIYNWRKTKNIDKDSDFTETINNYHNRYIKYYGGHQFRLGHYYRHLFQVIKYINKQLNIDFETKYEYVKILRAQLSTYEQAVLFLNSLSKMGSVWELNPEIDEKLKGFNKKDFELITKYNLIKNVPGETIYGINFKDFYPEIEYESDNLKKERFTYK